MLLLKTTDDRLRLLDLTRELLGEIIDVQKIADHTKEIPLHDLLQFTKRELIALRNRISQEEPLISRSLEPSEYYEKSMVSQPVKIVALLAIRCLHEGNLEPFGELNDVLLEMGFLSSVAKYISNFEKSIKENKEIPTEEIQTIQLLFIVLLAFFLYLEKYGKKKYILITVVKRISDLIFKVLVPLERRTELPNPEFLRKEFLVVKEYIEITLHSVISMSKEDKLSLLNGAGFALLNLGDIEKGRGNISKAKELYEKAVFYLKKAVSIEPGNPIFQDALNFVLEKLRSIS